MGVVAVHADGGVFIAFVKSDLMDTVMSLVILFFVAFPTGFQKTQGKVTYGFGLYVRVGIVADVDVTVHAKKAFFSMYGKAEFSGVDGNG